MAELQRRFDIAILVITHNLKQGPTARIFDAPRHPYTEALLSANPQPDPDAAHARITLSGEMPSPRHRPKGCEFHTRCHYAQADCRVTVPPVTQVDGGHRFTCLHPLSATRRPATGTT
jgi:peptide/nickel transport system ATP-binding protein